MVVPGVILAAAVAVVLFAAASPSIGWVHPELLGTSVYIWNDPSAGLASMLRKVLDWKAFDPNVNRVRPLNDFAEVIDATSRPYLVQSLHAILAPLPSTILFIVAVPSLFYGWSRRVLGAAWPALLITVLLISTTGFLSLALVYIRPAKRLAVILLVAALYFLERSRQTQRPGYYWAAYGCSFASFFADELGLASWAILAVLYWRETWTRGLTRIIAVLVMPFLFLALTEWGLPFLYLHFGVHGSWSALADTKKWTVFAYAFEPQFYQAAFVGLGRSILTTVGIANQTTPLVIGAAMVIVLAPIGALTLLRNEAALDWCLIALLVAAYSIYATLLDWYPFPFEVSYLGSYNFYYHSPLVLLVAGWIVYGWRVLAGSTGSLFSRSAARAALAIVILVIAVSNIQIFLAINAMVRAIHYYPYSARDVAVELGRAGFTTGKAEFVEDPAKVEAEFRNAEQSVIYGPAVPEGYEPILTMVQRTPILTPDHLLHMARSYFPWRKIEVRSVKP